MDVLGYLKTDPTLGDVLGLLPYAERTELLALQDWTRTRLAEIDLPDGQLVGVMVEGSPDLSAWTIECLHEPGIGPQCDVIAAGDVPSLLLSASGWEAGYVDYGPRPPRLYVSTTRGQGYRLRPAEPADLEHHSRA